MRFDESMCAWTAFRSGGPAEALVAVQDVPGWLALLRWCREERVPVFVLGESHGVLVGDGGVDGVVVVTRGCHTVRPVDREIDPVEILAEVPAAVIVAEAGATLGRLAQASADLGFDVPFGAPGQDGTVGGVVRRCFGELREHVVAVGVLTDRARIQVRLAREVDPDVDAFPLRVRQAIAWVAFALPRSTTGDLFAGEEITTGSRKTEENVRNGRFRMFLDPRESTASEVLQSVDVKGIRLRDVTLDEQDPNVAVNLGEGSSHDLQLLVAYLAERVSSRAGVKLEPAYRARGKKRQT